ncbi:hypothetical protein TNCV_3750901 [Trichonephila clavipes]|uniref:Uncharacterized protein n=1 Tax=Trichonephila clavipes TaxID=2585209 RepID=A0A8X6RBY6_TRICX|nr:hypothetical protein TNCV_3750901 [Trichonephila clavipes]
MLRIRKARKFAKCRNVRVSLKADFVDESEQKVNAQRISGRGIRFSNRFPIISVTLPDNAGRPYFRYTVAEVYLKILGARKLGFLKGLETGKPNL